MILKKETGSMCLQNWHRPLSWKRWRGCLF